MLFDLPKVALDIQGSNLQDADVEPFRGIKFCMLRIANTGIGDEGLANLVREEDVVYLDATSTKISDVSVPILKGLPKLRFLFYRETGISFQGSNQLHGKESLELVEP